VGPVRFLTKSLVVDAFRFMVDAAPIWFLESSFITFSPDDFTVESPEGEMQGFRGDYIVRYGTGQVTIMSPETFEKLHEPCDEEGDLALNGWEP
jgi:hypothetical protein